MNGSASSKGREHHHNRCTSLIRPPHCMPVPRARRCSAAGDLVCVAIAAACMLAAARFLPQRLLLRPTRAMGSYTYQYPRPALTVDTVIVSQPSHASPSAKVLLIQRKQPPCKGQWALPGGFVDEGEPLAQAAARELQEETSVEPSRVTLLQTGAYGDPGRDPRGWTVTVAFAAVVPSSAELGVKAGDDAADATWYDVGALPSLAFDHKLIMREAFEQLAGRPEVQAAGDMRQQLAAAAQHLQGPWTPPTE